MTLLKIIGLSLQAWWGGCLSAFATPAARYGIRLRESAERELKRLK